MTLSGTGNLSSLQTGLDYASSCIASKVSWVDVGGSTSISTTALETTIFSTRVLQTASYSTSTSLTNSTPYALCDSWPRLDGSTSFVTEWLARTTTETSVFTTEKAVYSTLPPPNCTIGRGDCDHLHSSYASASELYVAASKEYDIYIDSLLSGLAEFTRQRPPYTLTSPICGKPTRTTAMSAVGPNTCIANQATVQLLYWPATRLSRYLCESNASTTTLGPTIPDKPNTADYWDTTLTSPTVYIAIDGTWQYKSAGTLYTNMTRWLLPQSSTAVSSLCGNLGGGYSPRPINYADFNGPPPASAYRCQPKCFTSHYSPVYANTTYTQHVWSGDSIVSTSTITYRVDIFNETATENLCSTAWDDYRPALSIPPEFSTMAPGQHVGDLVCGFMFDPNAIFYDPPKALVQMASIIEPTLPGTMIVPATPSLDPGGVPGPATPKVTTTLGGGQQPVVSHTLIAVEGMPDPVHPPALPTPNPSRPISKPRPSQQGSGHSQGPGPGFENPQEMVTSAAANPAVALSLTQPAATHTTLPGPLGSGLMLTASSGQVLTAIQALPSGPVILGSATLTPGQTTSYTDIGNVIVNQNGLVVDGQTRPFSALGPRSAVLTSSADSTFTAWQLSPGGPAVFGAGVGTLQPGQTTSVLGLGLVYIAANGLIVNGDLALFSTLADDQHEQAFLTSAGHAFAVHANTAGLLAEGVTLRPENSAVTVLGHAISMAPGGSHLAIDGTMLMPGDVVTVNGAILSLDREGRFVVIDGSTRNLAVEPTTPASPSAIASGYSSERDGLTTGAKTSIGPSSPTSAVYTGIAVGTKEWSPSSFAAVGAVACFLAWS